MLTKRSYAAIGCILFAVPAIAWPHIHISTPHVSIPHVNIGPVAITPIGIVPKAIIPPADKAVNTVLHDTGTVVKAAGAAQIAPQVALVKIITGKEHLSDAARNTIKSEGAPIGAVGQAVSDTNAAAHGVEIVAAQSIAGNVGKTALNIVDGPTQLSVEFATTAAIEAGEITAGKFQVDRLAAEPLAAALRTAYNQYQPEARPITVCLSTTPWVA